MKKKELNKYIKQYRNVIEFIVNIPVGESDELTLKFDNLDVKGVYKIKRIE